MKMPHTVTVNIRPMIDDMEVDLDDVKRALGLIKTCIYCESFSNYHYDGYNINLYYNEQIPANYCSNCGRKVGVE